MCGVFVADATLISTRGAQGIVVRQDESGKAVSLVLIEKAAYPGSVDFIGKAQIARQTGKYAFAQGVRSFEL